MKDITLIGMPIWYGCDTKGTEKAFEYIKDDAKNVLKNKIKNIECVTEIEDSAKYESDKKLKYLDAIINMNKELYNKSYEAMNQNTMPIVIGGDHSLGIGSVGASLDYSDGDLSLIWIDAHTDIHTDYDTPSGNIHGIPVSVCIGRCNNKNLEVGKNFLKPENIFYIGCRDNDKSREIEEIEYIRNENIYYSTDEEIHAKGVKKIIEEVLAKVKTKYVHISFDFDSIIDEEFPAVNVLATKSYVGEGGIHFKEAKEILSELLKLELNITAIDMVEYNPLLDEENCCKEKFKEMLEVINL